VSQFVTVAQAAKLVGRTRQTLYRDYIKTGKLSAIQDKVTASKVIEISELVRVFGDLRLPEATGATVAATVAERQLETAEATDATARLQAEIAALKAENNSLRDRLHDKDEHIADLRAAVRLIEHKPQPQPAKRSWWQFGRDA
jgi:cell division protein FtsB